MKLKTKIINQYFIAHRFVHFVARHFIEDDCFYFASALAFTTLLAVVPLMAVGLAVFSTFPVFEHLALPVQNFIFENFVPATGKVIQSYLQQFTAQVSKLSLWGVVFLIITALLVMYTIEQAMNKIWRVNTARHGVAAFLLYWSILSLAPILLGLSLAASSYLFSLPMIAERYAPSFFLHGSPFVLPLIGFSFLYIVVPNRSVKIRHAFWGGLLAAILFETAKHIFAYYLTRYNTYELLYGAFATVPLFFIWVYWVWVITLLGAEISYALSVHHQRRSGAALDGFSHALLWLHQLWNTQHEGKGLSFNQLIDVVKQPFAVDADQMIQDLKKAGLIHTTAEGLLMLTQDLSQLSLYTLSQLIPFRLPTTLDLQHSKHSIPEPWRVLFSKNNEHLQKSLGISLEELFKS